MKLTNHDLMKWTLVLLGCNWFAMRLTHVHTVPHPEENPGVAHDNSHAAHAAAQHGVKRAVRSPAVPLAKDPPVAELGADVAAARRRDDRTKDEDKNRPMQVIATELVPPRKDRIYCMVPFLWNKSSITGGYVAGNNRVRYDEIVAAWGHRCDQIRFFIDPVNNVTEQAMLPPNVVEMHNLNRTYGSTLCGPEGNVAPCKHIWEKVWRMWVWVATNEIQLGDWFVKLDDDSFLFPENLQRFVRLKGWHPDEIHYFGNKCSHRQLPIVLGAAVMFSKSLLAVAKSVWLAMPYEDSFQTDTCADVNGMTEELTTAVCLFDRLKVAPESAVWHNREMILPKGLMHHLWSTRKESDWYWQGRDPATLDGGSCCSGFPLVFHNMKAPGAHSKIWGDIHGMIDSKEPLKVGETWTGHKSMQSEYYVEVINNLRLLRAPLVVAVTCESAGAIHFNALKALILEIFPERTIRFEPAAEECGRTGNINMTSVDVLAGTNGDAIVEVMQRLGMNAPKPLGILIGLGKAGDAKASSSQIDIRIEGDTVQGPVGSDIAFEWLEKDRLAAYTESFVIAETAEGRKMMPESKEHTPVDLAFMGRQIRERVLEKDKDKPTSPSTFNHLTGGEVFYPAK
jgi:hypothetical protein